MEWFGALIADVLLLSTLSTRLVQRDEQQATASAHRLESFRSMLRQKDHLWTKHLWIAA